MPSESKTDHVRKRCECSKWKECTHPWYVDYQEGKRRYRPNLDKLIGQHPADFTEAKREARRAIDAWLDGKSAADLLTADRPTLATLLAAYRKRPDASPSEQDQVGPITKTVVNGRPLGEWHADEITRESSRRSARNANDCGEPQSGADARAVQLGGARRSAAICGGKRARGGWMQACRSRPFRNGWATPTSRRPAPTSRRRAAGMRTRCGSSQRRPGVL